MELTNRVKLSQWEALLVESLRSHGWSNEELISRVKSGELPTDESDFHFEYQVLTDLVNEQQELFEAAVTQGYQIKYNTVRGIQSWIWVRFQNKPELLLDEGQESVRAALTANEKEELLSVLSFGWSVSEESPASNGERGSFRIEPVQRYNF